MKPRDEADLAEVLARVRADLEIDEDLREEVCAFIERKTRERVADRDLDEWHFDLRQRAWTVKFSDDQVEPSPVKVNGYMLTAKMDDHASSCKVTFLADGIPLFSLGRNLRRGDTVSFDLMSIRGIL